MANIDMIGKNAATAKFEGINKFGFFDRKRIGKETSHSAKVQHMEPKAIARIGFEKNEQLKLHVRRKRKQYQHS